VNNLFKSKIYLNGWRGNQFVWAGRIAAGGKMAGRLSLGASVFLDAYGYDTGQISGEKLSVDLAVDAIGATGGLPGAVFAGTYYGLETFYPGGAAGALNDYSNIIQQDQAADPNWLLQVYGNKSSFHPKGARDAIPDYKKSKKRSDVIDPESISSFPDKT
jgi:hypothetical protein